MGGASGTFTRIIQIWEFACDCAGRFGPQIYQLRHICCDASAHSLLDLGSRRVLLSTLLWTRARLPGSSRRLDQSFALCCVWLGPPPKAAQLAPDPSQASAPDPPLLAPTWPKAAHDFAPDPNGILPQQPWPPPAHLRPTFRPVLGSQDLGRSRLRGDAEQPHRDMYAADETAQNSLTTEMNAAEETAQHSLTEINAAEEAAAERTLKRVRLAEMTWKRAGARTGECEQV